MAGTRNVLGLLAMAGMVATATLPIAAAGQTATKTAGTSATASAPARTGAASARTSAIPRTAWGAPDLQGIWSNHVYGIMLPSTTPGLAGTPPAEPSATTGAARTGTSG